ncbi:hypothetical protein MD484_g4259, partial [Candolleomyces efflorescens]
MSTSNKDALMDAVVDDHREMYEYYEQYVKNAGKPDAQQRWANQLFWEIARHAVGEEIVIYPLMEKHLGPKGLELADQDRDEHQFVKEQLYRLEGMSAGTTEYDQLLKTVMDHLHQHNDSEEQKDLPLLFEKLGAEGAATAAASFKKTKGFAPTHPHPSAPNKPPFETLVSLMTAPVDKLRDAFAQFPTPEEKAAAAQN